jgi:hypothetical protein
MTEIKKKFDLIDILNGLDPAPHTINTSQFKRGIGDVVTHFEAGFRLSAEDMIDFGKQVQWIIDQLASADVGIESMRADRLSGWKMGNKVHGTIYLSLITPVQLADMARTEQFAEEDAKAFAEGYRKNRGRPI